MKAHLTLSLSLQEKQPLFQTKETVIFKYQVKYNFAFTHFWVFFYNNLTALLPHGSKEKLLSFRLLIQSAPPFPVKEEENVSYIFPKLFQLCILFFLSCFKIITINQGDSREWRKSLYLTFIPYRESLSEYLICSHGQEKEPLLGLGEVFLIGNKSESFFRTSIHKKGAVKKSLKEEIIEQTGRDILIPLVDWWGQIRRLLKQSHAKEPERRSQLHLTYWEAVLAGVLELHEEAWGITQLVSTTCYGNSSARGRIQTLRCWRYIQRKILFLRWRADFAQGHIPITPGSYEGEFWSLCTPLWAQQKSLLWTRAYLKCHISGSAAHAFGLFPVVNSAGRDSTGGSSEVGSDSCWQPAYRAS